MLDLIAADVVLSVHLAFVLFVVVGGALVLSRPRFAWLHVPAVVWGVLVEASGWVCPLTPLENALRHSAGESGYADDFVQHYLVALLYPEAFTRGTQVFFVLLVIAVNALFYGVLFARMRRSRP